jgi:CofH/MqnC-like protein
MMHITDVEDIIAAGRALARADAEALCAEIDLPTLGSLGESARVAKHGKRVTFVRVCELSSATRPADCGEAGELRLPSAPSTAEDALARVRAAARSSSGVPLTGFSSSDLQRLTGNDHVALSELAAALRHEGLEALAEVRLDELGDAEHAVETLRALAHANLGAWRATIGRASFAERLDLLERAERLQRQTGAFRCLAPLPRIDAADQPSTGYDDVRTVALARLMTPSIPCIQVDWPLYGPKLAQVAITFGADDIDGISPASADALGHRRSPREEIQRHIRLAFAEPMERNGRFEAGQ